MQNKPNLLNARINITIVPRKAYMKNGIFAPTKNEPNTNPILPAILSIYAIAYTLVGKYLCVLCALCEDMKRGHPQV